MTPSEYKARKSLTNPKDNFRDHMTDLELIFTMLAPLDPPSTDVLRVYPPKLERRPVLHRLLRWFEVETGGTGKRVLSLQPSIINP